MLSLKPVALGSNPILRQEVIGLLAPALGEASACAAVHKVCDALQFRAMELTLDEALAVLDRLAATPGLMGISARFAKTRAILLWGQR